MVVNLLTSLIMFLLCDTVNTKGPLIRSPKLQLVISYRY